MFDLTSIFSKKYGYVEMSLILRAFHFASTKHCDQRRKGIRQEPYVNHPIDVINILWSVGGVRDTNTLVAGILHDTVEDTDTSLKEIEINFGLRIAMIVNDLTDNPLLSNKEQKEEQVRKAPHMLYESKLVKLADKISNVQAIMYSPPSWSIERSRAYCDVCKRVVDNMVGTNQFLEKRFYEVYEACIHVLEQKINDN
jgi:guanosine-3',5'-bis(diphosphate) 3'-pyrophosphohydrolase